MSPTPTKAARRDEARSRLQQAARFEVKSGRQDDEIDRTHLIGSDLSGSFPRCAQLSSRQLGSHLCGCLSEFLASKNVINRTQRYEKVSGVECRARSCLDWPRRPSKKWPERVKKFEHQLETDRWRQGGKHQVGRLLVDLLSGRRGPRHNHLLELLRAPVVLAALFSFVLALSLFTLYTMSFHHCQPRHIRVPVQKAAFRISPAAGRQLRRSAGSNDSESPAVVVQTECASYEGVPEGGAFKFRGVAYASPPVGARRWRRPRPIWLDESLCRGRALNWSEQTASEHCVQLSPFSHRVSGSEDCLYLDIYTPAALNRTDRAPLPVMVYIHGGFLVSGSNGAESSRAGQANWMRARPSGHLASELDVVLVAPNFRLQALGFMALRQLALDNGPDGSEGNYGLWDQLAALQWIRRNIGAFGGDPDNVLLFGPDSAGALPLALADGQQERHSPDGRQLFHAVWLMNPTIFYELPYELANQHYARLIQSQSVCSSELREEQAGGPTTNASKLIECLMGLPAERVVREYLGRDDATFRLDDENSLPIRNIFPDQFVTLDNQLVRDSFPFVRSPGGARQKAPKVDFVLGSTAQAVEFWPCPRNLRDWSWNDFRHYVATSLNSFQPADTFERAAQLYKVPGRNQTGAQPDPVATYLTMVSDIRQVCPTNELARGLRLSPATKSLERYLVEWRPSSQLAAGLARWAGGENKAARFEFAFHSWDLLALFGFDQLEPAQSDLEFQRHVRDMARRLAWSRRGAGIKFSIFARRNQTLRSDAEPHRAAECEMWRQSLRQSYAWIS